MLFLLSKLVARVAERFEEEEPRLKVEEATLETKEALLLPLLGVLLTLLRSLSASSVTSFDNKNNIVTNTIKVNHTNDCIHVKSNNDFEMILIVNHYTILIILFYWSLIVSSSSLLVTQSIIH